MPEKKTEATVEEKLFILMAYMLACAMETASSKWNDGFARQTIKDVWLQRNIRIEKLKLTTDDLQQVSRDGLWKLGFRLWDGEDMWLLPLWLYNVMDHQEANWFTLDDRPTILEDRDLEPRGGCISVYFIHDPVAVIPEEEPEEPEAETQPAEERVLTDAEQAEMDEAAKWINGISGGKEDELQ